MAARVSSKVTIKFSCWNRTKTRRREPTYRVGSSLELFDRMMRLRQRRGLAAVWVKGLAGWSWSAAAHITVEGLGVEKIDPDRLTDTSYVEELAVRIWEVIECDRVKRQKERVGRWT
jgi:hypothetical protein